MGRKQKKKVIRLSAVLSIILILLVASALYVSDYYHADRAAIADFAYSENSDNNLNVFTLPCKKTANEIKISLA